MSSSPAWVESEYQASQGTSKSPLSKGAGPCGQPVTEAVTVVSTKPSLPCSTGVPLSFPYSGDILLPQVNPVVLGSR